MLIREVETRDIEKILDTFFSGGRIKKAYSYTREEFKVWHKGTITLEEFMEEIRDSVVVVAVEAGKVIAFGEMREFRHINRLYIDNTHQGLGVNIAILSELEKIAKDNGSDIIRFQSTEAARNFCMRQGYYPIKKVTREYKGVVYTNYIMEKELTKKYLNH